MWCRGLEFRGLGVVGLAFGVFGYFGAFGLGVQVRDSGFGISEFALAS